MNRAPLLGALAATAALFAVRIYAAHRLGFGDAEALYACYALHPQPMYVDHPGLIGLIARMIGRGSSPSPLAAHTVTACLATLAPWGAALTARAAGASVNAAAVTAMGLMLAPEISVGLFGLTPDLLLILLWYASLAASLFALASPPGSTRALGGALASGTTAALACDAKITGVLLVAGLAWAWSSPQARGHRRTLAPWAGLAVALVVFSPVIIDEIARGFPMLKHRLIDTQKDAGLSMRNVGALLGGQLVYVTPPLLFAAYTVARDLHRHRNDDAASRLFWCVTIATLPLVLLCCVSRVAEPHWVAPIYLALPLHLARRMGDGVSAHGGAPARKGSPSSNDRPLEQPARENAARREPSETTRPATRGSDRLISRRLATTSVATGVVAVILAHAWVLFPVGPYVLGAKYEARYDLANDLYAWERALPVVRRALLESALPDLPSPVIVGPHWTVCAQIHAALPNDVFVGCDAEMPDDFARWFPPSVWQRAPVILYVTDDRFAPRSDIFRDRRVDLSWKADVMRGGVHVRRITITRLVSSAVASTPPPSIQTRDLRRNVTARRP